ncbi:exosortase/archaeosortase family protein [Roseibacillus persicicus]|uniref:exosortase/archaeosortase family protein n=1 Tax=Roseibacillus persicicus TaxID=454148 RepID=UPI00280CF83A|nr:exosortase/archaeosortase family protein [Roseibacillus persicicus]MDQ8191493.1 exosortase/archaeosortase family protein [Roseibacillus persicicus]
MTSSPFKEGAGVAAAFFLALWPQAQWFVKRTFDGSDEPLGLLALATAAILAWQGKDLLVPKKTRGRRPLNTPPAVPLSQQLAWLALVLTVASSFFLPNLITAALGLCAVALVAGLFRNPGLMGLLFLSLPVMASLDFYLGWPVRLAVSVCSEGLLNLLQLPVTREGTLLFFQGAEVGVDPPCSGLRMLWFTAYLSCTLAAMNRLSGRKLLLLLPLAALLSIVANILRAVALFFPESGLLSFPHWTHEAIGAVLHLTVALGLLALVNKLTQPCKTILHSSYSGPVSA